jgi:hypothetical protein
MSKELQSKGVFAGRKIMVLGVDAKLALQVETHLMGTGIVPAQFYEQAMDRAAKQLLAGELVLMSPLTKKGGKA